MRSLVDISLLSENSADQYLFVAVCDLQPIYFFQNFNFVLYLLRLLKKKLKSPYVERNFRERTYLSFNTFFFEACSLITLF